MSNKLRWLDQSTFEMGGHKITLDYEMGGSKRQSAESDFTMMKSKGFLEKYLENENEDFKKILEVGVYQGGSFVFLDQLYYPDKIAAIELSSTPIPALDEYVAKNSGRARMYYGTSQDDEAKVNEIIETYFGGTLDLVVDDASHFYDQTKSTFSVAFPLVRAGGLYIIEDWAWSFQEPYQKPDHVWAQFHSLANLVIDIMEEMALGHLIENIEVSPHMMKVRRSTAQPGDQVFRKTARRGREYTLI